MSQHESIERIDKFIKRLDDRDIVFVPEKCATEFGFETRSGFFGRTKKEPIGTLGDVISKHLAIYQQGKSATDASLRTIVIDDALRWINHAYTLGAVKPSDGIYKKYEDCLDQIKQLTKEKKDLESELQEVSADLLESEAERKSLKHQLDEMGRK